MSQNAPRPLRALIVGRSYMLIWELPSLLARAGFEVDVIAQSALLRVCPAVKNLTLIEPHMCLATLARDHCRHKNYDWIIVSNDTALAEIRDADISIEDKLHLLPVKSPADFAHLYSKIGLSRTLVAHGIQTPPFDIAHSATDAVAIGQRLGYPLILKQDSSSGGKGVIGCERESDLESVPRPFFDRPVLVQRMVVGKELSLTSVFLHQRLVYYSYAQTRVVCDNKYGPSSVRTYYSTQTTDKKIPYELTKLGEAIGAHGIVNITCIESADGSGRYYIEADQRPNVWSNYGRYVGDDMALAIHHWFSSTDPAPQMLEPHAAQTPRTLPYFLRLPLRDLVTNRYGVWQFMPLYNKKLLLLLLCRRYSMILRLHPRTRMLRRLTPYRIAMALRRRIERLIARKRQSSFAGNCTPKVAQQQTTRPR